MVPIMFTVITLVWFYFNQEGQNATPATFSNGPSSQLCIEKYCQMKNKSLHSMGKCLTV